jgi:ribulose-5-phosphate 4-epimerase/fuculose-1-phosphate aldolase
MNDQNIRNKLAYAYRILKYLGLDDHTYTHLSARSSLDDSFYIYPFGLRFEDVTANTLLRASFSGETLEGSSHQFNKTGYMIHGAIYKKRPDIRAIFHIHTPEIVAVSACAEGLMPISQWALHFYGKVAYHAYDSLVFHCPQGDQLVDDLGQNYTMLLRNHGSVTSGRTLEEAMFFTYHLHKACQTQCHALSLNQPLITPSHTVCEKTVTDLLNFEKNLGERDWKAWVRLINHQISSGAMLPLVTEYERV